MPEPSDSNHMHVPVQLKFDGLAAAEPAPPSAVYAFDANGELLASATVEAGRATLLVPDHAANRTVRFFAGPQLETPTVGRLIHAKAVELRQRLDAKSASLDWTVLEPSWRPWLLCRCVVRGRLIKRLTLPDGTTRELPICHSRVTICEIFQLPIIIWKLPDPLVYRLRDELLSLVKLPFPPPPPPGDPLRLEVGPLATQLALPDGTFRAAQAPRTSAPVVAAQAVATGDTAVQAKLHALGGLSAVEEVRASLVDLSAFLAPYFCWWPWLAGYLSKICVATVPVDENGYFETALWHPCALGSPNLYFSAEQLHGAVWESIYRPSLSCHVHWHYACGTEVILNVTDPSAVACAPGDPVEPPAGVSTWIMPLAVGGSMIWGDLPGVTVGRVRSDGLTDYGSMVDAPFGSFLGFRHGWSINIPSTDIQYYRWRYRKAGTTDWFDMHETVVRHYVKQPPLGLPSFPAHAMGPQTIGTTQSLYEFKQPAPPPPAAGDPPGTITYWPTDDFFSDIYTGYLDTPTLPPSVALAAGQYQIKLEVFDSSGVQVTPGAAFQFIVPTTVAGDGTISTRPPLPSEIDNGGFVFNLHLDNNHCTGSIDAPAIGATAVADECGFLRYNPLDATPVNIAFHAKHPNNFAKFKFELVRGANPVLPGSTSGEVGAVLSGSYTGDGVGNFSHPFPRAALLGSCVNAAFAEHLHVYAKATTGWGSSISSYDDSALRAFALAPTSP